MPSLHHSPSPIDTSKLLQRIIQLRSHFKLAAPENISLLRKKIQESDLSNKNGGINGALVFLAGNVFSHYPGPISMGDFSRDLDVPFSTATRTMDWLVNNGYAQRLSDPTDRRIVRVELTQSGKEIHQEISLFMLGRVEQALNQLTPAERTTFIKLLDKVLNGFEETEGARS